MNKSAVRTGPSWNGDKGPADTDLAILKVGRILAQPPCSLSQRATAFGQNLTLVRMQCASSAEIGYESPPSSNGTRILFDNLSR